MALSHLAFTGVLRAELRSFHKQLLLSPSENVGSGNILPFNFRVPPLCTVTAADVAVDGIELSVELCLFLGHALVTSAIFLDF